jgi:hypothetical protein
VVRDDLSALHNIKSLKALLCRGEAGSNPTFCFFLVFFPEGFFFF